MGSATSGNDGQTNAVLIVTAVCLSLAWLALSLRVGVRTIIINAFGWDDFALLVTTLVYSAQCAFLFLTYAVASTIAVNQATGHVRLSDYKALQIYAMTTMLLYIATTIAFKIALGLFYLRIVIERWQRNIVFAVLVISTLYGVAYFVFTMFMCGVPTQYLEHTVEGKCLPTHVLLPVNIVAGLVNLLAEWIFAFLLVVTLHQSRMPIPAKISAGCLLLLGTAGSLCSVVRLLYIREAIGNANGIGPNFTMWSLAEGGICITAAALAATRPLFRCCLERARAYTPTVGSRRNGTVTNSSRRDRSGAHPLSDQSFHDRTTGPSKEFDPWPSQAGNFTTIVGNSRVMEKMGMTQASAEQRKSGWI